MVVAEEMKPTVQISVSDSDEDESSNSQNGDDAEYDAEVSDINDDDDDDDNNDQFDAEMSDSNQEDDDNKRDSKDGLITNEGWADSVAKILGSSKPKNKKTLVLSRAKKFSEIKKVKEDKPSFEVIGESVQEEKPEVKKEEAVIEPPIKKKKIDRPSIRVKPNILEKDRERLLSKIATKGVVQLFNAVRNQQKSLEKEMDSSISETKKEKILKKFDKRTFLDSLMGNTKSVVVDSVTKPMKDELKVEDKPKWNALRDDFMMGAKMKDWDKESVDE